MVEEGGGPRLGQASGRDLVLVVAEREPLDGDPTLHLGVEGEEDLAIPALGQLLERSIPVENERLLQRTPATRLVPGYDLRRRAANG